MMNILMICGKLSIGGAEKVAYEIGMRCDPSRFHIDYLVFFEEIGELEAALKRQGHNIIRIPLPSAGYGKFIANLRKLIRKGNYQAVHSHTMFNSGLVMAVARQMGVPIRISHAHTISSMNRTLPRRLYEKFMRLMIVANATDLVACGRATGSWLYGEKTFRKKGKLIPNGVDVRKYRFHSEKRIQIREQYGLDSEFIIGHVGRMAPEKNQIFLVELMPEILRRRPETVLMLVGDGDQRTMLENRIRELGITGAVIMTGMVLNVQDYLSAMDVFVLPSVFEGVPLSVIETQSNGLPCLLSEAVPGDVHLTDLIRTASLQDPAEKWISGILDSVRKDPESYNEQMLQSGFDIQDMVGKIYEIYSREE